MASRQQILIKINSLLHPGPPPPSVLKPQFFNLDPPPHFPPRNAVCEICKIHAEDQ